MLDKNWLSTCAPLGFFDPSNNSWKAIGAGVFIYDEPYIWFVTANHSIDSRKDLSIQILINHSKTKKHLIDIRSLHTNHNIGWTTDVDNDLAATLFPANSDFLIKAIDFSYFINMKDVIPSMICYSIGCPYSLVGYDAQKIMPCVLDGIISGIDTQNERIYITVPTFPGNSGGPLIIWKQPIETGGNVNLGNNVVFLGGIISQYVLVQSAFEQEGIANIPPMHLGEVIPAETIKKLLTNPISTNMKKQIEGNTKTRNSTL